MKELRSLINLLSSDIIHDPPVDVWIIDISYVIRYPLVENILKWKRLQLQVTVYGERYPAGWQYVLCASAVFLSTTQTLQQ